MNPKVSVIISAYNCEDYITEAVESIINQTFKDWEILIADDGSTDGTRAIIDQFRDERIRRFHNNENIGLLRTWNKLLEQATGSLITWQDGDDYSFPTRLEKLVSVFERDSAIMLCGSNYVRYFTQWEKNIQSNFPTEHAEIMRWIREQRRVPFLGASKMIRREVLDNVGAHRLLFDRLGWEDNDLIFRIVERYKSGNLPDVLYVWRYLRSSASRYITPELFLKISIGKIGFFLADQRWKNNGLDGLMNGGDKDELYAYIAELKLDFDRDPSVLYRWSCNNKINNYDFMAALSEAVLAVRLRPTVYKNYELFLRIGVNYFRVVAQLLKMRFQRRQ
jgi:glycosyltransferase involved in cell wall biosynthesis